MSHKPVNFRFAAIAAAFAFAQPAHALLINPTFEAGLSAPAQAVINSAIQFYQNSFSDPITVNIDFRNMNTGLGSSYFVFYNVLYSSYRSALAADATSADDLVALSTLSVLPNNPINGSVGIGVKSANGRAVGLNTPEILLNFAGSPCATFTGSGCIGLNVGLTTTGGGGPYSLFATVEHEIDEILGLGSGLSGTSARLSPWSEDLFRYASVGVRSYSASACGTETPNAFFSIDGGVTMLDQFNNCDNGGDYGDWITHTPTQVQDAFTNGTGNPALVFGSPEMRALDVIGFTFAEQSVPEPTPLSLLALGLAAISFTSRAKRAPG